MTARTITRDNVESPVTTYMANIHGRPESVPTNSPWSKLSVNVGTASRCTRRHQAVPIRLRAHDDASTITVAYIAMIPNAFATGR